MDSDLGEILEQINRANYVKFDRWQIKIEKSLVNRQQQQNNSQSNESASASLITNKRQESEQLKSATAAAAVNQEIKYMNNYLSIGCDALVTLNFHLKRKNLFFANRLLNKVKKTSTEV